MANVREIVTEYLEKNNFDGLCNEECGCRKDDLIPCEEIENDCESAYRIKKESKKWKALKKYYVDKDMEDLIYDMKDTNEWFVPEEVFKKISLEEDQK